MKLYMKSKLEFTDVIAKISGLPTVIIKLLSKLFKQINYVAKVTIHNLFFKGNESFFQDYDMKEFRWGTDHVCPEYGKKDLLHTIYEWCKK